MFFLIRFIFLSILLLLSNVANAANYKDTHPWGVLYYHSWMADNNFGEVLRADKLDFRYGTMDSLEFSYTLSPENGLRRFLKPIVSTIQVAGQIAKHNDHRGTIYEFGPYILLRWEHFPWDKYLTTTFMFSDGISYTTDLLQREIDDAPRHASKATRLLNVLMLEATVSLPNHPEWELVGRIHHRCNAWGTFAPGKLSSNAVGIGIRYQF